MISAEPKSDLKDAMIYIRNLRDCPPSYLDDPGRKEFFEIVWLKNEDPLHALSSGDFEVKGDWVYLIPPYRVHQLNKAGKNGHLISFKREVLEEEDKEFLLDIFKIFNVQGEFSCLRLASDVATELSGIYDLLISEYQSGRDNLIIVKAMLKVFLLKLIKVKEQEFTGHDLQQKRVYEFLMLLEGNYLQSRNIDFYAGTQLIHDRIILEAKRLIIHSEHTIKEISFLLGFSDRPYFSRFFKKQTNGTAEEFQKKARKHVNDNANTLV
jgi:AraC family transcriptional regulator, transcriptional activator of pobA